MFWDQVLGIRFLPSTQFMCMLLDGWRKEKLEVKEILREILVSFKVKLGVRAGLCFLVVLWGQLVSERGCWEKHFMGTGR